MDEAATSSLVNCKQDMNATDDNSKSSDGDWVIFENITTLPYDLRLQGNTYNEAIDHWSSYLVGIPTITASITWKPVAYDWRGNPSDWGDVGAYEFQRVIVKSSGGDYTTLSSAISAGELDIVIQGTWSAKETSINTVTDDYVWIIATDDSRHNGVSTGVASPTNFVLQNTANYPLYFNNADGAWCRGFEVRCIQTSTLLTRYIIYCRNTTLVLQYSEFEDMLLWEPATISSAMGFYQSVNWSTYLSVISLTNCMVYNLRLSGLYLYQLTNGTAPTIRAIVNSCTFWKCNQINNANNACIRMNQLHASGGEVKVEAWNSIFIGCNQQDIVDTSTGGGTKTWHFDRCIESFNDMDGFDAGYSNLLQDMNETDDCSKTSDGDWVIFEDLTTEPYDLRLCANEFNEALDWHNEEGVSDNSNTIPTYDIATEQRTSRGKTDAGAFELRDTDVTITAVSAVLRRKNNHLLRR
jgi:hypothetical protein